MEMLDRRNFLTTALAASPALALPAIADAAEQATPRAVSAPLERRIWVESEFAPLRKVVLTQSEVGGEAFDQPEFRDLQERRAKERREAAPPRPDQKAWEAERERFGAVLRKYGVEVLRPRKLTAAEKKFAYKQGYTNFFVRDPFFTVGDVVVEGSIRYFHRRIEVLPCRDIFEQHVYDADCLYVAAPAPAITGEVKVTGDFGGLRLDQSPGPFIEGGDVLVWGKRVYVGHSGQASSELGIRWLRQVLAPRGYEVEMVPLKENTLHLDCAFGMVREGLMVVCDDVLPAGLPKSLRDWDQIKMTEAEALQLGTNGFPINPDVYVMDPQFRSTGEAIEKRGVRVEYLDFHMSRSFGGSFRCSTQPLLRA